MATTTLSLATLLPALAADCADCGERLRQRLLTSPLVEAVHWSSAGDRLIVRYQAERTTPETLATLAQDLAATVARRYVHRLLPVAGLDCADCARALGEGLRALPGVEKADAQVTSARIALEYDGEQVRLETIVGRVRALGYEVAAATTDSRFRLLGLDCADCARTLERVVAAQAGVLGARVEFAAARLHVTHDPVAAPAGAIMRRVAEAGYTAEPIDAPVPTSSRPSAWSWLRRREGPTALAAIGLLVGLIAGLAGWPEVVGPVAFGLAILVGGARAARSGWLTLRVTRAPDMNVLMTLAVLGAVAIGEWAEAATIVVLFGLGTTLESLTMERARRSLGRLIRLAPETATVLRDGRSLEVPAASVAVGEVVLVRPAERLPLDGVVLEGESAVNQAPITGEAVPADKVAGDPVYAGTINGAGALTVRVTGAADETTLARIVRLVERAQAQRAPVERFVDRFARWYTPVVVLGAVLVALVPPLLGGGALDWFYRGLVLLVIACPCALVISTPVAIVTALGSAARRGILIKGGAHLEMLGRLRTMAFDKTGTLTRGQPALTEVVPLAGQARATVLALAAGLEAHSEHPIAAAIVAAAQREALTPPAAQGVQALPGHGLSGWLGGRSYRLGAPRLFADQLALDAALAARVADLEANGQTVVVLGTDETPIGLLAVADQLRPHAAEALTRLRRLGIQRLVMLTGDNPRVAAAIAAQVGVTDCRASLLPDQKTAAVADLEASDGPVAMVGDGINDTPALARASVGIAMGARGTAAALETADVALMADDLTRLPAAVALGQRTLTIIRQNIAAALLIKIVFVTLAVLGVSSLWLAVIADVGGSLLVTANALRLLQDPAERPAGPPLDHAAHPHH